ncbi:tetratricopeptide repeat protein [Halioxenophilus aromaticivorans]|uniref:Tetratricopeptide repeat protein n=1 Tax=Halioxenophilus aromaticivorans TaxID=1306992 RepID=A0AAV3U1D1_9ALTE
MKLLKTKLMRNIALALPMAVAPTASVVVLDSLGLDAGFAKASAQDKRVTRKTPAISQAVYKKLGDPNTMMNPEKEGVQPDFPGALAALKKIESRDAPSWNAYEKATLYNYMAYAYYSTEDFNNALKYYKLVIAQSPQIPLNLETATLYTVAQLQFVVEDYKGAIGTLNRWFKQVDPMFVNADHYALLSQAYYQDKQFDQSLSNVQKAISMYKEAGKTPKENWYSIEMAIQYDRGKNKEVVDILETLVRLYPKQAYYKQLAGMYNMVKKEQQAAYLSDANYVAGALEKETEVLNVAYMMLGEGYSYRAAKIIEKGIDKKVIEPTSKNLETLATAWRMSQEVDKSIAVMKEAASKADNGNLYALLAGNYVDSDQNKNAINAGKKALSRGGVKRMDQLQVVMGMASANLGNWADCEKYFNQAKKDKRSEAFAKNWIQFCQGEQKREESLASN